MTARPSIEDVDFKDRFEAGDVKPSDFSHRDHLKLVYVYLCESDTETASKRMRSSLSQFLKDNGVPASHYHETLTLSWTQAVKHFMVKAVAPTSFDAFIAIDDRLLDPNVMLTHYDRNTLFSDQARQEFVPPDLQSIPQYA
ncbi:hypothetical protein C8N43_1186 [Litoreibacter ponti]|uniref:Uncharacterized protein n=1 Tax=Litoreibacter ponti TaxID=1510457 RepID=A0A2T6BKD0_9RHOB|nr:hypothetical protein [Litoreibacter ponti]PTX56527.1 hypothetical protein C8N43_1186 [Litoreibacter ponti]